MTPTTRPSRYHIAKQDDGHGWMILRLEALGAGWSTEAIVVECNLPEDSARLRLLELRAGEVLEPYPIEPVDAELREAGGDPDAIGKRGAALVAQAVKLCGFNDRHSLEFVETHANRRVTEDCERIMADIYGCSVEWLRGDHVEPPAELVQALRDKGVSDHDRDVILEFAASIQDRSPVKTASERFAETREQLATAACIPVREKAAYVRSQRQTRKHHCHWPGCDKQVPPAMWGCKAHWFKLPADLRRRIWAAYVPGQEATMTPSADYLQVANDVQRWIREST